MKLKLPRILDVRDKVVFVRVDFNVPLEEKDGKIKVASDDRIRAALKTIKFLLRNNATVVMASHLGRPKSSADSHLSLKPIADYINDKLKLSVTFVPACTGEKVEEALKGPEGEKPKLFLLENLRFHKQEEENEPTFAKALAKNMDVYINEAFSTSHRAHASVVGITEHLPSFAGFALEEEVSTFAKMMTEPKRPLVIILGGAKISDKVGAIKHLADVADIVLVGGAVANSFIRADGFETYKSYIEEVSADLKKQHINYVDVANTLMREHKNEKMLLDGYIPMPKILHPIDVVAAHSLEEKNKENTVVVDLVNDEDEKVKDKNLLYLDIGPKTVKLYQEIIKQARTVFWNGPMGVWENRVFSNGSRKIAATMALAKAKTILGGGDTISAIDHFKLEKHFDYISAAGGAALDLLSGKMLPGIKPILKK